MRDNVDRQPSVRVNLVLGVALVLLCGVIGILLGVLLPINPFLRP